MANVRQLTLAERAWITIGLILGFYVIALALAGGLLLIPFLEWTWTGAVHVKLAASCVLGSLTVLWTILPRIDRFEAPGPLLERARQPRLFAEIDRVAEKMGQAAPDEVYLVPQMNAFVAERGGYVGWGSRRMMGIGLPLLQMLTVSQFRAVLAHEYGHYAGSDTRFGGWLYKVREDMGRTIESAEEGSPLHRLLVWYGLFFLRITQAFSREQEYTADLWAANLFGRRAIAEGLKAVDWGARCHALYWTAEVEPMLASGFLPPISEGFARFGGSTMAERALADPRSEDDERSPYDSHPSLQERLDALAGLPEEAAAGEDPSAVALLEGLKELDTDLVASLHPADGAAPALTPVRWEDAGTIVFLPKWMEMAQEQAEALAFVTVGGLPKVLEDWGWFIHRFKGLPDELGEEEAHEIAVGVLGGALAVALHGEGWSVSVLPGEEPACSIDGREPIQPFQAVRRLIAKELKARDWNALMENAGVGSVPLGRLAAKVPRTRSDNQW